MEMVTASEMMEIHIVLKWLTAQEDFRFNFIYLL
jgi:hypothetical protein